MLPSSSWRNDSDEDDDNVDDVCDDNDDDDLAVVQRFDSALAYNQPVMFEITIERPDATWSVTDYSRRAYHVAGCLPTLK